MTGRIIQPKLLLVALGAMLMFSGSAMAQARIELDVTVSLSRDTIGLDEQVLLEVIVQGATQDMPAPKLPTLPMFELFPQGRSTNISYSNGTMEASVTSRFVLQPTKAGTFPIENISVVYQNRRYAGNPVSLTVLNQGSATPPQLEKQAQDDSGNSRDYFLEAALSSRKPFVNQQVTLTLKFYIAVQYYGSPELIEPTTTGFWTELLGTRGPYQQRVNGRTYRVLERSYALFPTQTGELTIGRATITATVPAPERQRRRDPFDIFGMLGGGQEVQVRSQPTTIDVQPLPAEGRPDNFTGTIGRFTLKAVPTKTEVEVNQPVSVNISISGVGNIKSIAEPIIPDMPDFRVYRASANENTSKLDDRIGGTKTFEQVFIPRVPGRLEIPPISYNFFDPEAGRYRTLATAPIVLNVAKTEGYAASPSTPYGSPDLTIGADARDIRYIKLEPGDLALPAPLVIVSTTYLVVNSLPVLALMAAVLVRRRREKLSGDVGYARARRASKEAKRRLAHAGQLADVNSAADFYAESALAVLAFISDKLNISPHGLTVDKISELLRERDASDELITDTMQFLQACDFARYAPSAVTQTDIDQALGKAERLMVRMEEVRFS